MPRSPIYTSAIYHPNGLGTCQDHQRHSQECMCITFEVVFTYGYLDIEANVKMQTDGRTACWIEIQTYIQNQYTTRTHLLEARM